MNAAGSGIAGLPGQSAILVVYVLVMNIQANTHRLLAAALASVLFACFALSVSAQQTNPNNLPLCPEDTKSRYHNCWGKFGDYIGEFQNDKFHGIGKESPAKMAVLQTHPNGLDEGSWYYGEWKDGLSDGQGILVQAHGSKTEGIWHRGKFIKGAKVNFFENENAHQIQEIKNQSDKNYRPINSSAGAKVFEKNSLHPFTVVPQFSSAYKFSEGLAAIQVGGESSGKWGFIDKSGAIVINAKYEWVSNFSEGLAAVFIGERKNEKCGFINNLGDMVIPAQFSSCTVFNNGLAAVRFSNKYRGKYGYIDRQGKFYITPKFDIADRFNEGLAKVKVGGKKDGKWGFIDLNGKFVIQPQFYEADSFYDGLASVLVEYEKKQKWGFIDQNGNMVIKPQFDNQILLRFFEGLSAVRIGDEKTGKWGFIDKQGKMVINPQFDFALWFNGGLARVTRSNDGIGLHGFIDKQGRLKIPFQFTDAESFSEGFAPVLVGDRKAGKWGFIDSAGNIVVNPQFDDARSFNEGLAEVILGKGDDRKSGFISNKFEVAISGNDHVPQARPKINLVVDSLPADADGVVVIKIGTGADTASLKINGEEQGGRADGNYSIKKVARIGQDTQFNVVAVDINGNSDTKTITVSRQALVASQTATASLKPEKIKRAPARDAAAIIIGIQDYKRVPRADFANNDAKEFYEYAVRALGVQPEKIKMLVDDEADEINVVKAFENWLPIQVNRDKTDVYVFFSGHGLPAPDGKSLYFLPHGVDKELLSRTAVAQNEVVAALTAAKPRSVTMFIDACYSGQTRAGDVLVANAKPLALKSDASNYPSNFTVITASANDQISSSSPELKHGIFSFYLMKGMEGEADANLDGKITVGEMQDYLLDKVARQAMTLNRKQSPQLVGDANRVLVGK